MATTGQKDEQRNAEDNELHTRLGALKSAIAVEKTEIEHSRAKVAVGPDRATTGGMAAGFRVVSELLAGVLVGGLVGYGLDRWLGTAPWIMLLLLFIGFAAGLNNVYKLGSKPTPLVGVKTVKDTPEEAEES